MSKSILRILAACVVAAFLTSLTAQAGVVSLNFKQFAGDSIPDGYGVEPADNWGEWALGIPDPGVMGSPAALGNLTDSDGNVSTVDVTFKGIQARTFYDASLVGTPMRSAIISYNGSNPTNGTYIDLSGLNSTFVGAYDVIVYISGFNANGNGNIGAITDGTETFYCQVPNPFTGALIQSTDTNYTGPGTADVGTYVRFDGRTNDTLYISVDVPATTGAAGIAGFQIVGQTFNDVDKRTWVGAASSDWDTTTLNWTNPIVGITNYTETNVVFFDDTAVAASPTVNLTATRTPGNVTVKGTKNYTLTGSDIAGATGLSKSGSGILTLGNVNTYSGDTTVDGGSLKVGISGAIPDGAGAGDVVVASGATLDLNGFSEGVNGLSGAGNVDNTAVGAAALTVGNNNDDIVFGGNLQNTGGALSLIKAGTNTLQLTGTNTYTGATIVQDGSLRIDPDSSFSTGSAIVVSNGASLTVSITNAGFGVLTPSISLNGGNALTLEYGDASITGFTTPITSIGALNLNGTSVIDITGVNFAVGTYTLISYGSKTGGGSLTLGSLPNGMVATLSDTGFTIDLVVTAPSVRLLVWIAGTGSWDTTSFNWALGDEFGAPAQYADGDEVLFKNIDFGTVTVASAVSPFAVTLEGPYTLSGAGGIAGSTGVEKTGGTTFTIANANSYDGVTTVSDGTLQVNNAAALGSTNGETEVVSGGSLALGSGVTLSAEPLRLSGNGSGSNNGAVRSLDTNSPTTLASAITLAANARIRAVDGGELIVTSPITDNGSNYTVFFHAGASNTIVRMNSSSNVAGQVTVFGGNTTLGLVSFGVDNVFPGSELNVGGGRHDLNGTDQQFTGLDDGFAPENGVLTNSSASPSTVTIERGTNSSVQLLSPIGGNVSLVKNGPGVQSFGGGLGVAHTYSGPTTINEGVFGVSSDFSGATNTVSVNSGGTLRGENSIGGAVTVAAGGTIHAGFVTNDVGTLSINNDLSLAGDVIVALNKDEPQSNDVINVTGTLTYGGTLTILNLGTNALVAGDTFTVFPTGGGGSFSSIDSSNVPGATFSFLDGVITVDSVSAIQPELMTSVGGGNITFSWDDTGGPFSLEAQTNTLSVGLSTNWAPYPDGTNGVSVPINPANPTVFFRLSD